MLAIGRSVSRPRLHSSLPVTTSWTAADLAPTPAGPAATLLADAAGAMGASPAGAAVSAPASRAAPATRPVTRTASQPLVPMPPRFDTPPATGARLHVTACLWHRRVYRDLVSVRHQEPY